MNVKVSVSSCSSCFWFKFGVVKVYWVSILKLFGGGRTVSISTFTHYLLSGSIREAFIKKNHFLIDIRQ